MKKHVYFSEFDGDFWPLPQELQSFFVTPQGRRRFFDGDNDSWGLDAYGVDDTEHLARNKGRVDVHLTILGHRDLGVLLQHRKWGGGRKETYYSRGDLTRLNQHVKTSHGDLMPIGLFIPFETAWLAVKEFMERDGVLPASIAWIDDNDIPESAFPPP